MTTVDLRGHGASDRSDVYTVEAFADDLVETLPTGLDLVVGHSLGGTVLERAVGRLAPAPRALPRPGFRLKLPTEGLAGRLFWAPAPVTLTARGPGAEASQPRPAPLAPQTRCCATRRSPGSTGG